MPVRRHPRPVSASAPVTTISRLRVSARLGGKALGRLTAGSLVLSCVLGPAGLTRSKREGDGATPVGTFALRGGFFRADRGPRPPASQPLRATRRQDGWCDDPRDTRYNRPLVLPTRAGHERMWREDRLYDLGLVIDYNVTRPRKGRGSAIFLHVMHPEGRPTAGCIALRPDDLRRLLPRLARHCRLTVA